MSFSSSLIFFRHRWSLDSQVSHRDPRLTRLSEAEPPSRRSLNELIALRRRVQRLQTDAEAEGLLLWWTLLPC